MNYNKKNIFKVIKLKKQQKFHLCIDKTIKLLSKTKEMFVYNFTLSKYILT